MLVAVLTATNLLHAQNYPNARSGGNYMHNYYLPPAGSSTPWWPSWSPDGQWIAFASHGSLCLHLRVVNGTSDGVAEEIVHAREYLSSPGGRPTAATWPTLLMTAADRSICGFSTWRHGNRLISLVARERRARLVA